MKNVILLLIGVFAMTLSSCGTFAAYSSDSRQTYDDGIYNSAPSFKDRSKEGADTQNITNLIQQTKESPIYLFGDKKDSILIPDNMSATIRFDKELGTSVTIADFNPYYTNYWDSPWYYNYYSSPWSYMGYYDPWYYNRFSWHYRYDPWYYSNWYGGFYGGFYDPYYTYMHPHYCGWYGGWAPHFGGIHHHPPYAGSISSIGGREVYRGNRQETISSRTFASTNRLTSGTVSTGRKTSTTTRSSFGTSRTSSTRAAVGRSTTTSNRATTSSTTRSSTGQTYRKPAESLTRPSVSSPSYERSTSSSPSYNRGSSSNSSSSYNRGASSGSYNRSSSSGSYGGGGGYSRSSSGSRR